LLDSLLQESLHSGELAKDISERETGRRDQP